MPRVIRSPLTKTDAAEIWAYIAEDNPIAADRLMDRFDHLFRKLSPQPLIGKPVDEFGHSIRLFPLGSYLVFYRAIDDGVEIARILHGARDITAEFFRD